MKTSVFVGSLRRILWGESCAVCREKTAKFNLLCADCAAKFQHSLTKVCKDCGCARFECYCSPPRLADAGCRYFAKLAEYDPYTPDAPVNRLIYRLKRKKDSEAVDFLTELLAVPTEKLIKDSVLSLGLPLSNIIVTYLPRDSARKSEFGHDQAKMLAKSLAGKLGVDFLPIFSRKKGGDVQKTLSAQQREINVRQLFSLSKRIDEADIKGRTIIITDDLVTTGATAAACTRLLFSAGCRDVFCVAVAYSPKHKKDQ